MMNRADVFDVSARLHSRAEETAIVAENSRATWGDLYDDMLRWSRVLSDMGLTRGDRCAILAPPSGDYVRLLLSLWAIGVVAAPLNTRLPAAAILKQLKSIDCASLIVDAAAVLPEMTHPERRMLKEIRAAAQKVKPLITDIAVPLQQPATLIFTSGSTGESKACLHTFGNHYFNALGSNANIEISPGDRWLLSLPLFHVAGIGIVFRCLLSGAAIAVPQPATSLADSLLSLRPTHISLVATQLQRLLDEETAVEQLRTMKAILLGGSAMPEKLIRRAFDLGLPIFTSYGSTEMASQTTTTRQGDSLEHLLSSGRVLPQRELKTGANDEILARGACLGLGYLKANRAESMVDEDGWHHTGDCGFFDSDGYLHVTGRLDNMFISGGENIHAEEIEKAMLELDGVEHVVVVPVKDDEYGQRPAAFVKMAGGTSLKDLQINALRVKLPGFKLPCWLLPWPREYARAGIKIERAFFQATAEKMCRSTGRESF